MFRIYKYQKGERFRKHRDENYIRNEKEASFYTFLIYLNDNFKGGETDFQNISLTPKQGMGLVFLHQLPHAGNEIREGIKYVLRTDVMYRIENDNKIYL